MDSIYGSVLVRFQAGGSLLNNSLWEGGVPGHPMSLVKRDWGSGGYCV